MLNIGEAKPNLMRVLARMVGSPMAITAVSLVFMSLQLTAQLHNYVPQGFCVDFPRLCQPSFSIPWLPLVSCGLVLALMVFIVACFTAWFAVDEQLRADIGVLYSPRKIFDFHVMALTVPAAVFSLSVYGLADAGYAIFTGDHPTRMQVNWYCLDLAMRGMFFDIMEHFHLSLTKLEHDPQNMLFIFYSFFFRIYFSFMGAKIAWATFKVAVRGFQEGQVTPSAIIGYFLDPYVRVVEVYKQMFRDIWRWRWYFLACFGIWVGGMLLIEGDVIDIYGISTEVNVYKRTLCEMLDQSVAVFRVICL